nr:hypothetical protein [Staphylococcus pasteuri]
MGGIGIDNGDIGEMRSGEGKRLSGRMGRYLNGLGGGGVDVMSVNE